MRIQLVVLMLLFSSTSFAGVCKDSDQGLIPEAAGKVIYSLGADNCLGDSCYTQVVKEFDRCVDGKTLLEFACQQGEIVEKEILCAPNQLCKQGACVKK